MTSTTDTSPARDPSSAATKTWRRRAYVALLAWMVFSFTVGGLTKFYWGDSFFGEPYAVKFAEWGYPSWFRFVVGSGELFAAGLLINRNWRFLGAAMLVTITAGATLTHLINQDPLGQSIAAPTHLILAATVAYAAKPDAIKALFTPPLPPPATPGLG